MLPFLFVLNPAGTQIVFLLEEKNLLFLFHKDFWGEHREACCFG